ncbi:MAG TPA: Crp/Fnr family transcriptional regulator [Streptosporangiaceae bacterium]|jgi:CRP-like cAMP-binding protein|nr:Crp/Fnr family transcriptional regulator [Streptosporangiaceae bacterium]
MLTYEEQSTLHARSNAIWHDDGAVVITEGVHSDRVVIVRSGWCKVTAIKADRPVLLRLYRPGDLLGIAAALTGTLPAETVTVTGRWGLHALSLHARSFTDFLRHAPNASAALHRLQLWRLEEADRLRTIRAYPTAAQRLAGLLAELCRPENDPHHHRDGTVLVPAFDTALSQEDLGNWIGDSRKTVGRALAQLRDLGLARSGLPHRIRITAPDRLHDYVAAADAGRLLS